MLTKANDVDADDQAVVVDDDDDYHQVVMSTSVIDARRFNLHYENNLTDLKNWCVDDDDVVVDVVVGGGGGVVVVVVDDDDVVVVVADVSNSLTCTSNRTATRSCSSIYSPATSASACFRVTMST